MKRYDIRIQCLDPKRPPHLQKVIMKDRIISDTPPQEIQGMLHQKYAALFPEGPVQVEIQELQGDAMSSEELRALPARRAAEDKELKMIIGPYLPMSNEPNLEGLSGELIAQHLGPEGTSYHFRLNFRDELLGLATGSIGKGRRSFKIYATDQRVLGDFTLQLMNIEATEHIDPGPAFGVEGLDVLRIGLLDQRKKKAEDGQEHRASDTAQEADQGAAAAPAQATPASVNRLPLPKVPNAPH